MWGTVCYQNTSQSKADFSIASASVACFQLGFTGAQKWFEKEQFGTGSTKNTWFKNVECTGNETRLDKCKHDTCKTKSECSYCDDEQDDVGIRCEGDCR